MITKLAAKQLKVATSYYHYFLKTLRLSTNFTIAKNKETWTYASAAQK